MLLRLYCLAPSRRRPSPTHNHAPSLCDDLIRRGSGAEGNHGNGTRATSAVGSSSTLSFSSLRAVSLQPPASSLQPSSRQRSTVSRQPPAPHQSDEKPPPSHPNRSADFSPVRREASSHKPRSLRTMADPAREAAPKTSQTPS